MVDRQPGHWLIGPVKPTHQQRLMLRLPLQHRGRQDRHERQGDDQRPGQGKEHREGHGAEELSLRSLQKQDRHIDNRNDEFTEHGRPPHLQRRIGDHLAFVGPLGGQSQPADTVLHHDHRTVDHQPEVDRPQTHQARRDAGSPHQIGREEHRQRDCQRDDDSGPHIPQQHQQHAHHQQPPLGEVMEHRVERAGDELGAVVENLKRYARGKCGLQGVQTLLGCVDNAAAVLPAHHHHHAGDHFAAAIACGRALPGQRRDGHLGDVADQHRHAPGGAAHHDLLDILQTAEQRTAPDEPLLAVGDDVPAAGAVVVAFQRRQHLTQRNFLCAEAIGVDPHLVALGIAPMAVDIGDAGHLAHGGGNIPLQHAAQIHQILPRAPHLKLQNLAQGRAERAELGLAMCQRHAPLRLREPFGHQLPGPKDIGALVKHNRHQRDAKPGDAAHLLHARQAADGQLHRIGHIALHLQRREGARLRHDLHLHVDQIGHGIDRNPRGGIEPACGH